MQKVFGIATLNLEEGAGQSPRNCRGSRYYALAYRSLLASVSELDSVDTFLNLGSLSLQTNRIQRSVLSRGENFLRL